MSVVWKVFMRERHCKSDVKPTQLEKDDPKAREREGNFIGLIWQPERSREAVRPQNQDPNT